METVTLKTLPFWARVGQIVTVVIEKDTVKITCEYSYLEQENCLSILDPSRASVADKKLSLLAFILRINAFRPYMFCRRVVRKIKYFLRKGK